MVIAIIIAVALIGCTTLLCFKGVTITYKKSFTVKDERYTVQPLTTEQVKDAEKKINAPVEKVKEVKETEEEEDTEYIGGPMDSVIAEMHALFGPDKDKV